MAAITTSLLTVLEPGDHLLVQGVLYGGTMSWLAEELARNQIELTPVNALDRESWSKALKPNTKAFYCETISNPLVEVPDLQGIVRFCKQQGLVSMIDNTFASPVFYRPIEAGFDLALHSATKYLNGHSDIVAGVICSHQSWISKIRLKLNLYGGSLDPHACFLLQRGLKTLALRVPKQAENAMHLARFLSQSKRVRNVFYPGLECHSSHKNAKDNLSGFGGMLAFELDGSMEDCAAMCQRLRLPLYAPSLGGVESLITIPALTTHAAMSAVERHAIGIGDSLVRVSLGIESYHDLNEDFEQALKA